MGNDKWGKRERGGRAKTQSFDYLEISVHDAVLMTMIDALQYLLDAVWSVRFAVEFSSHNVLEEFTSRHPVDADDRILIKFNNETANIVVNFGQRWFVQTYKSNTR